MTQHPLTRYVMTVQAGLGLTNDAFARELGVHVQQWKAMRAAIAPWSPAAMGAVLLKYPDDAALQQLVLAELRRRHVERVR